MSEEQSEEPTSGSGGSFPRTRWSLVQSARDQDSREASRAIAELCELYWFPLYSFVRRRGYAPPDAEDLTQEFFRRILENNDLGRADADRGKLRSFLLGAMKHFLSDARDSARAQKRGGGKVILSLDQKDAEDRFLVEPAENETPETLYEKQWARTLLHNIMQKLNAAYQGLGKGDVFEALSPFIAWNSGDLTYADIAPRLGMTEKSVQVTVFRMRKKFGELLRKEIADTVASEDQVAGELQHISAILSA